MKKKTSPQDEMTKIQQDMLAREVDEELQREHLKALWLKYRFVLLGVVLGVLLFTIGLEIYHSWRIKSSLEESDLFENAVVLAYTGETDKAVEILKDLTHDGNTGYAHLAQMKLAGIYFAQNKTNEALAALKNVMDSRAPKQLKAVATLSYVGHEFESANPEELQKMLKPLLTDKSGFYGSAAELSAALYLKADKPNAAVTVLKGALASETTSPVVKQRLNSLLSVIEK